MKWWMLISGLVGVLVLTGGAAYLVGRALPAEHVAERARLINAGLEQVSERIRRVEAQPKWRRKITRIEVQSRDSNLVRYTEYAGRDAISFQLAERAGGRQFESRIISTDLPFGGRWVIELDSIGVGTTRVFIREEGVVRSPVYRALGRYVFGHTATMDAYLDDLTNSLQDNRDGT